MEVPQQGSKLGNSRRSCDTKLEGAELCSVRRTEPHCLLIFFVGFIFFFPPEEFVAEIGILTVARKNEAVTDRQNKGKGIGNDIFHIKAMKQEGWAVCVVLTIQMYFEVLCI